MRNEALTLGSLFDGSGGFPLGGLFSGITTIWASEIEPFPIRVTTKRMPWIKHYGDVSQMDGGKVEPVDIITFGSPCQDMSVAGRRTGLGGSRSCLFYEAVRIIKEMRCATNGKYPRYIVWENVPGAFSSNNGEDFKAVLETVIGVIEPNAEVPMPEKARWPYADCYMGDGWSVAYRVLDAQYWGVPQRRKRIFLVADFAGRSACDVLFKSEGMSGYSAESFRSWQRAAGDSAACLGAASTVCLNDQGSNRMDVSEDVSGTLRAQSNGHPPIVMESAGFCTEHSAKSRSIGYEEERSPTLRAEVVPAVVALEHNPSDSRVKISKDGTVQTLCSRMGTGGDNVPLVMNVPTVYGICSKESNSMKSGNPHSGIYEADTSRTLDGNGGDPSCNQGGMAVVESYAIQGSMIGRSDKNGPQGDGISENVSFTLNTVDRHAVYAMTTGGFTQVEKDISSPIMARDYKDPQVVCNGVGYTVRRLTPTECARLQGFPDWWCSDLGTEAPTEEETQFWRSVFKTYADTIGGKMKSDKEIIKWLKNPHTDSAEYKMWGNGVALPCVAFVLAGIAYCAQ